MTLLRVADCLCAGWTQVSLIGHFNLTFDAGRASDVTATDDPPREVIEVLTLRASIDEIAAAPATPVHVLVNPGLDPAGRSPPGVGPS
jgi:hypothetical protein